MSKSDISLTVLGGGQEIGANSYLLEWNGHNILLDAGLDPRSTGYGALPSLDILRGREIDAIIISHAHLDHIGSLPVIFANYLALEARIFLTKPNVELVPHMLMESVKAVERERIQEGERYYYHKLFDRDVLDYLKNRFSAHDYNEEFEILPGITATFFQAGHILGSAGIVLCSDDYTFVYTGDICKKDQTIHGGCLLPVLDHVDGLMIESTHGLSAIDNQFDHNSERLRFASEIMKTIKRGGHVLIPCFGLGRTQDMIAMLHKMKQEELINNDLQIYYHFGVTAGVNKIYDSFPGYLKNTENIKIESLCTGINGYNNDNTFKNLADSHKTPSIFIFTSGMLSRGTPAAHLAGELVQSEKHGIFFVGYAAPGELGYELSNIKPGQSICIDIEQQKWIEVVCPHIHKFAFSAHAYRHELLSVASHFNPDIAIWVHGDRSATTGLSLEYAEQRSNIKSISPSNRDTIMLKTDTQKIHSPLGNCRAVIVTVGTSLISNYMKKTGKVLPGGNNIEAGMVLEEFVANNLSDLPSLAAETNCLSKVELFNSDFLYFVCGDSVEGLTCGSLLKRVYEQSYICRLVEIEGLRPDEKAFNESGAKNLIEEIANIINRHGGNAIIHATGGFKAQIALATLLGIVFHNNVYYLFEDFKDIVCLPQIPLDFDYQSFLAYGEDFFRLLDGREYWNADEIYGKMPEILKTCFYKDNTQRKYNLTPLGRGMYESLQRYLSKKAGSVPFVVKGHSSLWGEERDTLNKILNPVIGIIIERLNHFSEFVRYYEFSSIDISSGSDNRYKGENCLEFVKKTNESLVYYIYHTASQENLKDILTIFTLPGTTDYMLKMIGKKIYP